MPGSSRKQDAARTGAEGAVQVRPPGSIVKRIEVAEVPLGEVAGLIRENHYTHSCAAVASHAFGVYLNGELLGAAVITTGAARSHRLLTAARPSDVVTLSRLWLSDCLPKNSESRVLGVICRRLRAHGYKALVTFADPAAGHVGTIYRAAGFRFLGRTGPEPYLIIDGAVCHPRSVSSALGSNDVGHLRRTGIEATRVRTIPKFRYVVPLDKTWGWRVRRSPNDSSSRNLAEEGAWEGQWTDHDTRPADVPKA